MCKPRGTMPFLQTVRLLPFLFLFRHHAPYEDVSPYGLVRIFIFYESSRAEQQSGAEGSRPSQEGEGAV